MNPFLQGMRKALMRVQQQQSRRRSGGGPGPGFIGAAGLTAAGLGILGVTAYNGMFTVREGQKAVIFNKLHGVRDRVYSEGTHLCVPWLDSPTFFSIMETPKSVNSKTGTRDLQTVDITVRVLYKPSHEHLPEILRSLGTNYDERVLPSIANETLKSQIAHFTAAQLLTQREQVSRRILDHLTERARDFNIIITDVSITHLGWGTEFKAAIENKQVAAQQVEKAKYRVIQAEEDKRQAIIRAEGDAEAAKLIGQSIRDNPKYIQLLQFEHAKDIARIMANSNNTAYLSADTLLLNVTADANSVKTLEKEAGRGR